MFQNRRSKTGFSCAGMLASYAPEQWLLMSRIMQSPRRTNPIKIRAENSLQKKAEMKVRAKVKIESLQKQAANKFYLFSLLQDLRAHL